ncbi:hypothetical protein C8Q79DRAFT_680381 [Trametes meyenii]|nr:hypothetical protein C8Q79DRAFT_680381 [Trametes meyenii]
MATHPARPLSVPVGVWRPRFPASIGACAPYPARRQPSSLSQTLAVGRAVPPTTAQLRPRSASSPLAWSGKAAGSSREGRWPRRVCALNFQGFLGFVFSHRYRSRGEAALRRPSRWIVERQAWGDAPGDEGTVGYV